MNETQKPVADWVLLEAAERGNMQTRDIISLRRWYRNDELRPYRALCDMIAKYEQPPVDPDVEAVKRIIAAWLEDDVPNIIWIDSYLKNAVAQYKQERAK